MNIKLFKKRDFSLLMYANLVSRVGTYFQEFALSLYVLNITGSATKFASILSITIIPQILLGPFMGVLADRFDRKKIIVGLDLLSGIVIAISAVFFKSNNGLSLWYIYFLVTLLSIISLLFSPAIAGVIPSIMKQEELLDANAISSVITNIAMVISPIIAGLLFSKFGILVILFANSISFILSAIGELFINIPKIEKHAGKLSGKSYLQDLKEGLKFTVSQRDVLSIMLVALVANFALNPITNMGFTYVLKENLKCSNSQVGLFQTIMLAGMFIAPIVSTTILKNTSINKIITINMSLCGVFIVATALLVSPLYLSLFDNNLIPYVSIIIIVILIAIFITIINIFLGTMFQKKVPLTMLGRVGAVLNTIGAAMTPLGQMVFGILFDVQAAFICFIIAGVIVLLSVLLYTIINRKTKEAEENVSEVIS